MSCTKPPPSRIGPRNQFRLTSMLLSLVTAINNKGRSILKLKELSARSYHSALDKSQPYRDLMLNSITTVLVRNHEVVAAVLKEDLQPLSTNTIEPHRNCAHQSKYLRCKTSLTKGPWTLPDASNVSSFGDTYFDQDGGVPYLIVRPGQSHWPDITRDPWSSLQIL